MASIVAVENCLEVEIDWTLVYRNQEAHLVLVVDPFWKHSDAIAEGHVDDAVAADAFVLVAEDV